MTSDLRTALQAAGDEFKAARDTQEQARRRLQPLMVEAFNAGFSQTDVVALSGYTRESVRRLARRHGITA